MIELAGRTCYRSEDRITPDSAVKFITMICKNQHESVLEHAAASFQVTCDRGVMAELTRHRLASFSVESTRYCNYGKEKFGGIRVIEPPGLGADAAVWRGGVEEAETRYLEMLGRGASPQIARSLLPLSLATDLVMTTNLRNWRHILKARTPPPAHPQMRQIAEMLRLELVRIAPTVFAEFAT